jgi:hypothetical protein
MYQTQMYLFWNNCFVHFHLGCRFCCFMRRRRRGGGGGGGGGGDGIFCVSCGCGDASFPFL